MKSVRVPGFLPSRNGFHFANHFASGPVLEFRLSRLRVLIGDAANGLCGGMAFAARDLFERAVEPPPDRTAPPGGTLLFAFLVRRLFDSFDLPAGPLRYLGWMWLPDRDLPFGVPGVRSRALRREWPKVRTDLDSGRLSPLGLVRLRSWSPLYLGRNHQVLAYGYDLDESSGRASILVYDPNHPDDDSLRLTFVAGDPSLPIEYVAGEDPVRGFFRAGFRPPPARWEPLTGLITRGAPQTGR